MIEGQELPGAACAPDSWNANPHMTKTIVELFFPEPDDVESIKAAKFICGNCPVAYDCLDVGLSEQHGIWGGMTEAERKSLRRYRRNNP